jgi:hypothetical protein
MKITNCPICYQNLEVVETTPCAVCGCDKTRVAVLKQDIKEKHIHDSFNFASYRAFEKIEVNLCNICTLEFTSFDPVFFGFSKDKKMWPDNFQLLEFIEKPQIEKDKFCKSCNMRFAFINFTLKLREANSA